MLLKYTNRSYMTIKPKQIIEIEIKVIIKLKSTDWHNEFNMMVNVTLPKSNCPALTNDYNTNLIIIII